MATPATKAKGDGKVRKYFREVRAEMRKVNWPNRKELITYTGVVLFATVVVALFIAVVDLIIVALARLV